MTDTHTEALKPCPFCGHKAKLIKLPGARPFAECQGRPTFDESGFACGARTGYYSTDAEAIAAWNTRAAIEALPARNDERALKLVEALRELREAASHLPRTTPAPGGASTIHIYRIPAWAAWANDRALNTVDEALAALADTQPSGETR